VFLPASAEATLTLLGALKVTSSSCDGANDVRLGGAFLDPDHEFRSSRSSPVGRASSALIRVLSCCGWGAFCALGFGFAARP